MYAASNVVLAVEERQSHLLVRSFIRLLSWQFHHVKLQQKLFWTHHRPSSLSSFSFFLTLLLYVSFFLIISVFLSYSINLSFLFYQSFFLTVLLSYSINLCFLLYLSLFPCFLIYLSFSFSSFPSLEVGTCLSTFHFISIYLSFLFNLSFFSFQSIFLFVSIYIYLHFNSFLSEVFFSLYVPILLTLSLLYPWHLFMLMSTRLCVALFFFTFFVFG